MHRTIYSRSHSWVLANFPFDCGQEIRLPRGKTQSIESIEYVNGQTTYTLNGPSGSPAGSDWQEALAGDDGATIRPPQGDVWPSVDYDAIAPVTINFTAGWLAAEVPDDIRHALLFAIGDAFDTRGSADQTTFSQNFKTRDWLISPYKLVRWY